MNPNRRLIVFFVILISGLVIGNRPGQAFDIQNAPDDGLEMQLKDKQIAALSNQIVELENELVLRDLDAKRDQELFRRQIFEELAQVKSDIQLKATQAEFQIFKRQVEQQLKELKSDLKSELKSELAKRQTDLIDSQTVKPLTNRTDGESRVDLKQSTISHDDSPTTIKIDEQVDDEEIGAGNVLEGEHRYAALGKVIDEMAVLNYNLTMSSALITFRNFSARAACAQQLMDNAEGNWRCVSCLRKLAQRFEERFPNSVGGRMRTSGMCKMRIERYPFDKFDV